MHKHRRMVLLVLLVLLSGMFPVAQPATPVAAAPVDEIEVDDPIAPQAASVPFRDGFEAPSLGADWFTQANNAGVVEFSTDYAHTGNQGMFLGQEVVGNAFAALVLEMDLSGQTDVFLDFWVRATGSSERRRLSISDDSGASWTQISDLDNISQNFSHIVINLADVASKNGLALNDKFRIRFSYFDINLGDAGDGMVLDDLRIGSSTPPPSSPDNHTIYLPLTIR